MGDKKVPDIRFAGYVDDWEQRRFSELYEKISKKNDLSYGKDSIISVANMYYKADSCITDTDYLLTYNIFELGDIAFEGNKSKDFAHGRFVENTIGNGIVSHVFDVFKPIMPKYSLLFWKYAINNERLMGKILIRSTKASTMMTNLVSDDFLAESFYVPQYEEQRQIGTFLDSLDNLITLHQREYDKLLDFKKAMLEKMFPKEGKKDPEVRFKGFTEDWEQRKVGDFLTISRVLGHTGIDAKKLTVKLWGKGVVEKTDLYGGSENTQYYVRNAGQFMYGKLDFLHAAFGIVPESLDTYESTLDSPAFDMHEIDGHFLLNRVTQEDFYLRFGMIANGSRKAKRIHEDTFLNMPLYAPCYDEQVLIGNLFTNIDDLITLHQRELETLKNIKSALLQKMFV